MDLKFEVVQRKFEVVQRKCEALHGKETTKLSFFQKYLSVFGAQNLEKDLMSFVSVGPQRGTPLIRAAASAIAAAREA